MYGSTKVLNGSKTETRTGEYTTLRKTSGVPIPLRYVKLRVPSHGSYRPALSDVLSDVLSQSKRQPKGHVEVFSSTDTLQPDHSILVAYVTGTDSTDLRLADNLRSKYAREIRGASGNK